MMNKDKKSEMFKNFTSFLENKKESKEEKIVGETTLLIDISYLFKSHFSSNTAVSPTGIPVSGISGVVNNISRFAEKFNADKVICLFDGVNSRDRRRKLLETYKANRDKGSNIQSPFDLSIENLKELERLQLSVLYELCNYLPVKKLYFKELEADDLIGYIVTTYFSQKDGRRIIISADKDFYQLIDNNTQIYHPRKKLLVHKNNFRDQWDTYPENIIYYRIIEGDQSDNIKGVKGWGIKTIEKFFPELKVNYIESLEEFQKLIDQKHGELIRTKTGAKLINQRDVLEPNYMLMDLRKTMLNTNEKITVKKVLDSDTKDVINDSNKLRNRLTELDLLENIYFKNLQLIYNKLKY